MSTGSWWPLEKSISGPLELSLYRYDKIAFSVRQEEENDLQMPFDNLIIAFSTSLKSHFRLYKWQKLCSHCTLTTRKVFFVIYDRRIFGCTRDRKYMAGVIWFLETFVSRPQPHRILGWSRGQKCVQCDMRVLEISLSRLLPSRILCWSRGIEFRCLVSTRNIDFLTSPKMYFGDVMRRKVTFNCNSTTWIVALSTW